tara:strand:+ start:1344 stop:1568 length:225 start_codon:yes stop_codon:yes gene_type:complete
MVKNLKSKPKTIESAASHQVMDAHYRALWLISRRAVKKTSGGDEQHLRNWRKDRSHGGFRAFTHRCTQRYPQIL